MTFLDLLNRSALSRLDAEVLLAFVLRKPRTWIFAHENEECSKKIEEQFVVYAKRRKAGEPVALITGKQEFFGRSFQVTCDTLIPRSSTEALVEEALKMLQGAETTAHGVDTKISILPVRLRKGFPDIVVDIGTGSGCIAITLAKEGWTKKIVAIDTSKKALSVAKKNAKIHDIHTIKFIETDGAVFIRTLNKPFLVISNPPYIPEGTHVMKSVRDFEPKDALFAGREGLDVLLPLAKASKENTACIGIVLELQTDQVEKVMSFLGSGIIPS